MSTRSRARQALQDVGRLVEEYEGQRSDVDLSTFADDPVSFAREIGRDPVEYQADVLSTYVRDRRVAWRGCHACGKEHTFGTAAAHAVLCRGMLVLVISATEGQVVGQTMREVTHAFRAASRRFGIGFQRFQRSIRIGGEDLVNALTGGANVDALTGWHWRKGVLVIISEGQGERLEDVAYDAAFGNAADEHSRILVGGNPVRPTGRFYETFQKPGWTTFHTSAFETPNVRAGKQVLPGFPAPNWPEEIEAEYGRNTPFYVGRVLAEFPDEGEESLYRRSWLDEAADRNEDPRWLANRPEEPLVVSVDPARYGPDATALTVRKGPRLTRLVTWRGKSTMETVDRVVEELKTAGIQPGIPPKHKDLPRAWKRKLPKPKGRVVVDVVGIGAGIVDRLKEMGYKVTGYNGGQFTTSTDRDKYLNERARSHWHFRKLLEDGEIALPRDEELFEELMAVNWFPTTDGRVQIERKKDMKGRLGRSPDRADAVIMAFSYQPARLVMKQMNVQ